MERSDRDTIVENLRIAGQIYEGAGDAMWEEPGAAPRHENVEEGMAEIDRHAAEKQRTIDDALRQLSDWWDPAADPRS